MPYQHGCAGAAIGNILHGVPLDEKGYFFEPLWTDFGHGPELGILDWYTVTVALAAFLTLALHGALWVALMTEGPVNGRCRRIAGIALYASPDLKAWKFETWLVKSLELPIPHLAKSR